MPPVPSDYYKIYKGSTVTISPQFFDFIWYFVFSSGHHQELVQGPHPGEGTDVSPACHELLCDVVQDVWGFQILAWCMSPEFDGCY